MKTKEAWKISQGVFEKSTEAVLHKLSNDGFVEYIRGIIDTGKEADVFIGYDSEKKPVAVKIFRFETSGFQRQKYIVGDKRFDQKKTMSGKRGVVEIWTQKEFKNLERAFHAGVNVPKPITSRSNVLVMEFLGENEKAYPLAKDEPPKNPKVWMKKVIDMITTLYKKACLVHGDLSEYNLMNVEGEPYIIDMGQAVLKDHPLGKELLMKDIENVLKWFKRLGVDTPEAKSIYNDIIKDDT